MSVENLITEHLDIWTSTIKTKSTAGRGSSNKLELVGVKKLRELILELAVRGKLVPQDPNDEPASVLLKKIEAEKARLVNEGKIKKQQPLPLISEDEKAFELPKGWVFSRLGEIIQISSGTGLTAANMNTNGRVPVYGGNGITGYHDQGNIFKKTLVIGRVGYYCGSIHLTPPVAWITDNAFVTTFSEENIFIDYLAWLLKGTNLKEDENATAQPVISGRKIYPINIALPPTSEQYRIVAKIEELMALCDQLETQTESSIQAHQVLVETLLATLSNAKNADELNDNWQTISQHFDVLFTTQDSIDQLKQTILQLAVMGKLVKQDPNDEPASKLLERIATEKQQLIKDGKIKKQKPLSPITDEEKPFELPEGWEWVRFGLLFKSFSNGLYKPAKFYTDNGVISLRMYNIQNGEVDFNAAKRVEVEPKELEQFLLETDDLLINRVNSKELVGKTAIVPNISEPLVYESMNMRAKPHKKYLSARYLNLFMMTKMAQESISSFAKEAIGQASINQGQVSSIKTPLPPLAEQHFIVAKVDELMALCDSLKVRLNQAQTTQLHLTDAIVEQTL